MSIRNICKKLLFKRNVSSKCLIELNKQNDIKPFTASQYYYKTLLKDVNNKVIIANGPAGCGKTWLACSYAINELKSKNIEKLVITRPIVSVEEELGFLPGNINKKMEPWMKPIFDTFLEYCKKDELTKMLKNDRLEIAPLAYMRGRTFKNSVIIADEMQNSSCNQMLMLLTRIGLNSRMIITGDLDQSDLEDENGLEDLVNKISNYNNDDNLNRISKVDFDNNDIKRSKIAEKIVKLYSKDNNINKYVNDRFNSNDFIYL
jgi:phosphate starvation-inducible PhoH-like protein